MNDDLNPDVLEVPLIGPLQRMRLDVLRALGATPPQRLDLSWKDNGWKRRSAEVYLPKPPSSSRPQFPPPRDSLEKAVREVARDEIEAELSWRDRQGW